MLYVQSVAHTELSNMVSFNISIPAHPQLLAANFIIPTMFILNITVPHLARTLALLFLLISLFLTIFFFTGTIFPGTGIQPLYAFEIRFNNTSVLSSTSSLLDHDYSNQSAPLLVKEAGIAWPHTLVPWTCIKNQQSLDLMRLYNDNVVFPGTDINESDKRSIELFKQYHKASEMTGSIGTGYYTLCSVGD